MSRSQDHLAQSLEELVKALVDVAAAEMRAQLREELREVRKLADELRREREELQKLAQKLKTLDRPPPAKNGNGLPGHATDLARYWTVPEVAQLLGRHPNTIRGDIKTGTLEVQRLGGRNSVRVSTQELERYISYLKKKAEEE